MLRVADRFVEEAQDDSFAPSRPTLAIIPGRAAEPATPPARYGAKGGVNVPAVILILLAHAIVIAALIQARQHVQRVRETRLSVVNLTPPPASCRAATWARA
ncbi:TonB-like protein [Sphingobium chlorophenolicum]|uniref:TonB-like protein n=1 Tax=Sphingobium chlorophenolicum TaxID=46429 RepID=A0A081RFG7_SPHCR|nr:TonB-like protein [Sphingobium chlorophenolicum]